MYTSRTYPFQFTDGPTIERDIAERDYSRCVDWLMHAESTSTPDAERVIAAKADAVLRYFAARRLQNAAAVPAEVTAKIADHGAQQGAMAARLGMPPVADASALVDWDSIDRLAYPALIPVEAYAGLIAAWAAAYRQAEQG